MHFEDNPSERGRWKRVNHQTKHETIGRRMLQPAYRRWGPLWLRSWSWWDPQGSSYRRSSSSFHRRKISGSWLQLLWMFTRGGLWQVSMIRQGYASRGVSERTNERCTEYLWTWKIETTPLPELHWMVSTRPWTRLPIWGRGREKCHAAFRYGAKNIIFPAMVLRLKQEQVKVAKTTRRFHRDRLNTVPDVGLPLMFVLKVPVTFGMTKRIFQFWIGKKTTT